LSSLENTTYHSDYHPLFEIDGFLNGLVAFYPNTTQVHKLGHSGEGREMVGITISKGAELEKTMQKKKNHPRPYTKPSFVIIGAQHAREVRFLCTYFSLFLIRVSFN